MSNLFADPVKIDLHQDKSSNLTLIKEVPQSEKEVS